MTSAMICREMLPGSSSKVKFPIPFCDMFIPHEHALWNVSKGGSDTVTRFTWNCQSILPIRSPQTVILSRLIMLFGVTCHRLYQAVTFKKKPGSPGDTLESVRNRANKNLSFSESLRMLSKSLLRITKKMLSENDCGERAVFLKTPAPQFVPSDKEKRFAVDHSVFGGSTGFTPLGKGKGIGRAKQSLALESNASHSIVKERNDKCTGFIGRIYERNEDGTFKKDRRHSCDLCKARNVTTICAGCKRVLCFDIDRSEAIIKLLEDKEEGERLRKEFPSLASVQQRDVPAFFTEVGEVNGRKFFMGLSCWHIAHPNHFCSQCSHEEEDVQLVNIAASGSGIYSPQR